ncbi:SDR family NAD(P)-dependent oxidoreductase [Kitasatospora sp. NBC_01302]|uniref:SDR family NAD(P)-dependent oxidoreductase n=1 Tax=Kitasatospora sp. NBC_01302 TaxID=2903575 RepID=UPI002E0FAD90|nr:SDR family NAD(P)-dependent oxidoreductase [Kitasatospora sp. NBC_01302]
MTDSSMFTETFTETLTVTADNPLLAGHVVYGRTLLPGVGYVDMVLQVLARHGMAMPNVELRNLTILAPLVAAPGERVLTTVAGRPAPAGGWRIEVRSRRQQDTSDVLHAVVTALHRPAAPYQERLALPLDGVQKLTPLTEIYAWCRQYELFHSGLMKIGGAVHHRPGDWIAELELAPEHQGTADAFLFHPALFEAGLLGGGVGTSMLHQGPAGPELYLPLVFESFRAAAPLGRRCFVRVPVDSVRRDDELIRLAVEFYDAEGQKVAEVSQFVAKRVRAAAALDVRGDAAPAPAVPVPAVPVVVSGGRDVVGLVRELVAARLGEPVSGVDVGSGYYELGLGSADLLSVVADLEGRLGLSLSPTVMFEYKTVADLAEWLETQLPEETNVQAAPAVPVPAVPVVVSGGRDVVGLVRELVAARLGEPVSGVDVGSGYYELGLGSADLLSVVADLEGRLGLSLSPTVMFEYKTVADLAQWLETQLPEETNVQAAPAAPVVAVPVAPAVPVVQPDRLATVRAALLDEVAALLEVPVGEVDPGTELAEFGFDWAGLAQLADRLNSRYGTQLTSAVFAEHRTVQAVAAQLVDAGPDRFAALESSAPASPAPAAAPAAPEAVPAAPVRPHPMLHRAVPDAGGITCHAHFDGSEPYLSDHRVRGGRVLPGVAHLEMARAAVALALGAERPDGVRPEAVRLDGVVWLRPAVCGPRGLELRVGVRTLPGGGCDFTIDSVDEDGTVTLCSQGRASLAGPAGPGAPSLHELRAACAEAVYGAAHVYGRYERMGMDYGPAQRTLVELRVGTDGAGRRQVLAELSLPAAAELAAECRLNPAVLDGALQATIGLWLAEAGADGRPAALALPFAVQRVETPGATPARSYAWIRHQPGSSTEAAAARLDVTVLDEHGRVCVELTGLSTRALPDLPQAATPATAALQAAAPQAVAPHVAPPVPSTAPRPARPLPPRPGADIAIVGVSGRYPQAADLDEFWQNLRAGRDCVREVPAERWDHRRYADPNGANTSRWGGFLDDIDQFDPLFFQISPFEADYLDPQERLFLQCAHHALEDAGYTGESLARSAAEPAGDAAVGAPPNLVGVFVGVMYLEYQLLGAQAQERGRATALWGSASTIANRVSYVYDFHGPSMAVDTMCSSSLTAIHLACEAIRSGQCDSALAGGVNLSPHPNKYLMLGQRRFLSSDGRCRSFGEGGDGYVPSEGVGAVLLKPLERAVADGDHVYGVIKGTALNHGGRTTGYSVPTPVAQGQVIARALTEAGVDPRALSYLEAHGTGTSLGDPIEIDGLTKAFGHLGGGPQQCAIGSVKSNIGHAESAAGIAAVTKVLLQLKHGELVPSLHSGALNPHIDFARTPFRVQQRLEPWQRPVLLIDGEQRTVPRLAGVSSFGGGGSNAHVVIAEYQEPAGRRATAADGRPALLLLSAQSEGQLVEQARRLSGRLAELGEADLPDVAWTLQTGRLALPERLAFAATSPAEARAQLAAFAADPQRPGAWARGTARTERAPGGEALRAALADWSDRAAHQRLLALWVEGAAVDWAALRPVGAPARRISLPGYPFARERHWVDPEAGPALTAPLASGAAAVPLAGPAAPASTPAAPPLPYEVDEVLLRPVWSVREAGPADRPGPAFAVHHVVLLGRFTAGERETLRAALPAGTDPQFVELADGPLDRQYTEAVQRLFALTRGILEAGVRQPVLLQVALVGAAQGPAELDRLACFGALAGLLKTAQLEHPLLHTQYLECLDAPSAAALAARLLAEAAGRPDPEVRHRDGRRQVAGLAELTGARPAAAPWQQDGVYLITGGAGGLGLIVAREIAASVGHATVVLAGRSPLDAARRGELAALRAAGLTVDYQRADVGDRAQVARLLAQVADNHGPLTGILHSAGVIEDGYLVRKTPEELARVLAPKVAGLVNLDELSQDQPLALFVCFSSLSGAFGNPGQGDYAAANAFLDAYAGYRNRLVAAGLRSGATVSVGWPLWAEGGMGDAAARELLSGAGLAPLDTARGLAALRCALAGRENGLDDGRLLVVAHRRGAELPWLPGQGGPVAETPRPEPATAPGVDQAPQDRALEDRALEDRAVGHLRRLLATALGLGPERLDPDAPLERYGMDSVLAVNLVSRLEETFGPLSRTLLFEVQSVRGLARHFVADHPQELRTLVGAPAVAPQAPRTPAPTPAPVAPQPQAAAPQPQAAAPAPRPADGAHASWPRPAEDAIAVIGIGGRFPQAEDLDAFWDILRSGKDCVTEVPAGRFAEQPGADPDAPGAGRGWWGAFLDGVDRFDPLHFGISPREAVAMDPQQRLFLETVWHLLEQSGVTQEVIEQRYRRRVGVYVGSAYQMYRADESDPILAALTAAASFNLIANRVSHFFGLEGPSLAVDSMCTSSTMAIHLACADLLRGESELAVAGGVNLTVHPDKYTALAEMQLLGSHPGSRSFRDGDGYLPAEVVGAVLLKPLAAALRDGDTVHAVIKGTASMHAGRSNGFMTPSHRTQVKVLRQALERAGATPDSIGYVEAAASGTAFSDEVELRALREVFGAVTEPVAVGTVKSNLGHPEAASGIAQLAKVVLQLRHQELAPLVEVGTANPNLDLDGSPLRLCERLTPWEPRGAKDAQGRPAPRRALINSVAAGGSHVTLVVEAPPPVQAASAAPADPGEAGRQLVVLSARTPERLRTAAQRLHDFLAAPGGGADEVGLADLAYTAQLGREALPERLAVVAGSREELTRALAEHLTTGPGATAAGAVVLGNAEEDAGPLGSVLTGARGEAFLAGLVADGDLEHLAELWVRGARVPWAGLHQGPRRLVPLPATAFEAGAYWLGRRPAGPVTVRPDGDADPDIDAGPGAAPQAAAAGDALRTMTGAWSELLGIDADRLGARSNFFSLGGNSLLATRLINLLARRTGVQLSVQAVFDAPKLAAMAGELERRLPSGGALGVPEVDRILASIGLIESMTDEELDALGVESVEN